MPADLPEAKAVQPRVYGADVLAVDGSYEDAHEYCRHRSAAEGWYDCSAGATPYAIEGTRTLGFELGLGATAPDWVVVPMGNGGTLAAAWKGLRDVERLGYLDELPKMLGVQAAGATPIYDAFTEQESRETPAASGTAADSIDVRGPHSVARACRALEESDGDAVVVDDGAISRAQRLLGKSEGLFVEPASAAAVAGVEEARQRGVVGADEKVIVVATGTGLKDTATAKAGLDEVGHVGGDIDDS